MANQEHLKILHEKVEAWNEWRLLNPSLEPDLSYAQLVDACLTEYDLRGANLRHADLSMASLRNVNFEGADLRVANLSMANLDGAILSNCRLAFTVFADNDLSLAQGLETVRHDGPSFISIDTIYRSHGKIPMSMARVLKGSERLIEHPNRGQIPHVFLRGAGVPENFIRYISSLVGAGLEFYSCFISYSSKDQEFVTRLHDHLQSNSVRCWYAPEDLKIGAELRHSFDEAIRLHDKLMVILSEKSVQSPWVEDEVEAALEKERQQNRIVLFPIRLDDAVMETDRVWAAKIRRTRNIGDFRNWKDHDSYRKAFDRLLRDLKAERKAELAAQK